MKKCIIVAMIVMGLIFSKEMRGIASSFIFIVGKAPSQGTLLHPSGFAFIDTDLLICDSAQSRILIYNEPAKKISTSINVFPYQKSRIIEPQGVCIDQKSNIYISQRNQVIKLDPSFQWVDSIDIKGHFLDITYYNNLLWICSYDHDEIIVIDPSSMKLSHRIPTGLNPASLAFNSSGELLVSETGENRISFYNQNGERLRNPLILGRNSIIDGIAIGQDDLIYLHDSFYYQIHVYSKGGGRKISEWELPGNTGRCWSPSYNGIKWNEGKLYLSSIPSNEIIVLHANGEKHLALGSSPAPFELLYPRSSAVFGDQVHILDTYASNVKRYTQDGQYLGSYGSQMGRGRMDFPSGISINENREIFILNSHSNILWYNENGQFQREITIKTPLSCASDLAVGSSAIYIADPGNHRVLVIDQNGMPIDEYTDLPNPSRVYLDKDEKLFVSDRKDGTIRIFEKGRFLQSIHHPSLGVPGGMTTADRNTLWVTDLSNHQLHVFLKKGELYQYSRAFGSWGGPNTLAPSEDGIVDQMLGKYAFPEDITFNGNDFYVTDRMNQRVQKIQKKYLLDALDQPVEDGIKADPLVIDFGKLGYLDHPVKSLHLSKTGTTNIEGSLETDQAWIQLSQQYFTGDTTVAVSVNHRTLKNGENLGEIKIKSNFNNLAILVRALWEEDEDKNPDLPPGHQKMSIILQINNPKAMINGQKQWIDSDNHKVVPVILPPGRTFVPIRFISEAFGARVEWDGSTRSVRIFLESKQVRVTLQIDNMTARINQEIVTLDAPPQILNGRTFVPLRFIAEAFGADIRWDGSTQQIDIEMEI